MDAFFIEDICRKRGQSPYPQGDSPLFRLIPGVTGQGKLVGVDLDIELADHRAVDQARDSAVDGIDVQLKVGYVSGGCIAAERLPGDVRGGLVAPKELILRAGQQGECSPRRGISERNQWRQPARGVELVLASLQPEVDIVVAGLWQLRQGFAPFVIDQRTGTHVCQTLNVIHPGAGHGGKDPAAPTTILVDGEGTVRWLFRPNRFLERLSPAQLLAAIEEHMPERGASAP